MNLLREYHAFLNLADFTWEQCYEEYVYGTIAKWSWFLIIFANWGAIPVFKFFAGQLTAFMDDHKVSLDKIQMIR